MCRDPGSAAVCSCRPSRFPALPLSRYLPPMSLHVTSEIGPLESVLVHTPGLELEAVTPGTREAYLYDDIIEVVTAQREQRQFVAVVERFAQVFQVRTLLGEVLQRT